MPTNNKIPNCPPLRFPEFSDEWTTSTISKVCKVSTGSMNTQDKVEGGDYPFYVRSSTIERTNRYTYDGIAILTPGDGAIGKIFHYSEGKIAVHQRVYILSEITIDAKYLFYYFSGKFYNRVIRMSAKNTVDSVRMNMITDMPISQPSFAEQKKIADFLSLIDERIQCLSETIKERKREKAALLNQLFSQKIRFLNFSDDWQGTTLEKEAFFQKGVGISKESLSEEGHPVILYGELYTTYKSEIISHIKSKTGLNGSDLVRTNGGEVIIPSSGETALDIATARCVIPSGVILGGDLNVITLKNGNGIFLSYLLNGIKKKEIAKVAQGSSVVHLYSSELKKLFILFPSPAEQKKIADFLSLVDERIEVEEELLQQYERQKRYLLKQMFV